jgi:hypothetical protein
VSLFFVLPSRPALGDALAGFLQSVLPGLDWDSAARRDLGELVGGLANGAGVFVVYREDLPAGAPLERALIDGCGAEAGDEVVEVRPAARMAEWAARRWRVAAALG